MSSSINLDHLERMTVITLNDPARRNALTVEMLEQLCRILDELATRDDIDVVLLQGAGPAFCAGFDLGAIVEAPMTLQAMITGLGGATRRMRSLPMPIIVAAHGAAIAGGCAMLSAADLSVLGDRTTAGYPVHRLGVSPAVTLPTLMQAIGEGPARTLALDGQLHTGAAAHRLGLGTHLVAEEDVQAEARRLCERIVQHGSTALRATKQWLGTLDGSSDESRWSGPIHGSEPLAGGAEAVERMEAFWAKRRDG